MLFMCVCVCGVFNTLKSCVSSLVDSIAEYFLLKTADSLKNMVPDVTNHLVTSLS